jgi:hypothetical protein
MKIYRTIKILLLIIFLSACSTTESKQTFIDREADLLILKELKDSGVDFSKKQLVDFFILAKTESYAKNVSEELSEKDFKCTVSKENDVREWTIQCKTEMLLEINDLVKTQEIIELVARQNNGFFDGWGAPVK